MTTMTTRHLDDVDPDAPLNGPVRPNRITGSRPAEQQATFASGKANPIAHLTPDDIEDIGRELDALRDEVMGSRGEADARYIRKVISAQRILEMSSRAVLLFSKFPPAFIVGTAGLTVAKILENTEIGHNILHGQWDWMRDPKIHSTTWEWDFASPAELWKKSHNVGHHTYTNVLGMDNDLGYNILRVDQDQEWKPVFLFQPITNLVTALIFEYGIAAYDLDVKGWKEGTKSNEQFRSDLGKVLKKIRTQMGKDYVVHPLLSGPSFLSTLLANAIANTIRNLWTHSVIFCGHFPEGVETFETESIENETRGEWYLRQMLGSANISGSKFLHLMSGNLSFQVEHHLFPDMPSNRYAQIAPRIRALMDRYHLHYVTGPLPKQVASAWGKVFKYSLPNKRPGHSRLAEVAGAVRDSAGEAARQAGGAVRRVLRRAQPQVTAGATA
ncbi:acyl-CoA desaturase [Tessaracoccus sp. OS52]|uniref:fatty acid desaturase family protein n=1 Tax=Tessaracoccus sp. OS52 TaxID=2886691 RepID=UPI001D12EABA|nr:acyl-CoA desaturase [Tessaracoccus sp. OS52]MCC2594264.1 acyl-CoA desaturase [Tessaracoccus sp. OS52]